MPDLTLLTLNIANPSLERARQQLAWLASRPEQILVLTETKASEGCRYLADAFRAAGYTVVFPVPAAGEYGTMIVSKVAAAPDTITTTLTYLPARAAGALINTTDGPVRVLGVYVPSRDASAEKTERKQRWLTDFTAALVTPTSAAELVLMGDLNVLEPDHQPKYRTFLPFEYAFYTGLREAGLTDLFRHLHADSVEHSWVGKTGDGYRYDHAHASPQLATQVRLCEYVHEPRLTRLSDHSALTVSLAVAVTDLLITSDPVEAVTEPTLF